MAEKKSNSRALKAVNDTKKKTGNPSASVKKKEPADTSKKKETPVKSNTPAVQEPPLPLRAIGAVVALGLFVLFLFMGIKPEGALINVILKLTTGLVGTVGFYFSIPALLYLFIILVSSKNQPVRLRCWCLISTLR